ncbi:hypothetical protein KSP39_PZI006897 [Platanthera zijinensis]|uniref:Coilin n=1 Tax=Platanthera zijinensis TaxID=2320716 RepID=A0AAP0BRW7_9ASPA
MDEDDGYVVRFRLVFDDRRLLDKSLRSQGLRRCWFLLKPGIETVGDLASHICQRFGLQDSIVLSMGDFVLPSFESTCIITDKDIITVNKKQVKEKDSCKPFDGQSPTQDSQMVKMHDLPFSNDLLSVDKSQNDLQSSGGCDKEKMISCTATTVHLDPPGEAHLAKRKRKRSKKLLDSKMHGLPFSNDPLSADKSQKDPQGSGSYGKEKMISCTDTTIQLDVPGEVGLAVGKRKHSEKPLGSNCQSEENNHDHESGPSKSSDVGKNDGNEKQSPEMIHHSSDGEGGVAPFAVQSSHICIQPRDDKTKQQADEPRSLLFDGSSSMNTLNKENNLLQTDDDGQCFKIDEAHVGCGLLPLPSSRFMIGKPKQRVHFESLLPLRRLPVKGDILAYRCAALSSSVYHVILSPQVGKVSSFDYSSLQITLLPVLDYEILLEQNPDGAIVQQSTSSCKENESIQIDYSSLVDVRWLKTQGSEEAACRSESTIKNNWEEALVKGNGNGPNVSSAEQSNGWPQWSQNKSPSVTSWSKQHNHPFAGRSNGRTNWPPNRGMNAARTNNNTANRNFNMNATNLNPNICAESGNNPTLAWNYRPPHPWHPNINFPAGGKHPPPGKQ